MMSVANIGKNSKPIILTGVLLFAAIVYLFFLMPAEGTNLWIDVTFFVVLNISFIVALVLGIRTKNKPIVLLSVLLNGAFFTIGMLFIFLYLFVIAIT